MTSSEAPASERQKLRLPLILSGGIKVGSAGLAFLMFLFLAHALGPEAYGRFATMFSLGSFLGFVVLLGQHDRVIKHLSGWLADQDFGRTRSLVLQSILAVASATVLVSAGLWLVGIILKGLERPDLAATILGALPFIFPFAFAELYAAFFRAHGAIGFALIPRDIAWRVIVIALAIVGTPSLLEGMNAQMAMVVISAALLGLIVLQAAAFVWILPRGIWSAEPAAMPRSFWADSTWLWIASMVGMMAGHLSVVFTSVNLSDLETGAFFAAAKVAQLLQLPIMAANIVAGPIIARDYAKSNFAGMQNTCRSIAPLLIAGPLLGAFSIVMASDEILSLFDASYTVAVSSLLILTLAQLINAFCGPSGMMMMLADGEKQHAYFVGLSEALGLALIFLLAPIYGLVGAALSALVGKALWNFIGTLYCYRRFGVNTSVLCLFMKAS